ncbi:hypothetical protein C6Y40_03045 [Alteromonas alba]|uniref:Uncharacterized protein n=2 Tax=Alteromonas alba TaxID=2079529 RepID=A0A2S9VFH5_9ALTE|nr:hypothetical protein C6Y40_03045 [Alteromonas alba]
MKRFFIIAVFSFYFSTAYAQKSPGTPEAQTLEGVFDRCVTNYSGTDLSFCVSYGFKYQTVETSFDTPNGYKIQFKSDIIESGSARLKVEHYDIKAFCTGCTPIIAEVGDELPELAAGFKEGVFQAHKNSKFYSRTLSQNGVSYDSEFTPNVGTQRIDSLPF